MNLEEYWAVTSLSGDNIPEFLSWQPKIVHVNKLNIRKNLSYSYSFELIVTTLYNMLQGKDKKATKSVPI